MIRFNYRKYLTSLIFLTITFLIILCSLQGIFAAEIFVSTTGNDSNSGATQTTAMQTISSGINAAGNGGTVYIMGGTYSGAGNVNLTISNNLTMIGDNTSQVTIDGTNSNQIITINNSVILSIFNINFVNGVTSVSGGAITATAPSLTTYNINLTITNCSFENNNASTEGGAIFLNSEGSFASAGNTNLTIINCTFTNNTAGGYGGSISVYYGDTVNIINSSFNNCSSGGSGAVQANYVNLTFNSSNFTGNSATSSYGGVSYYVYGGNCVFTIDDCIFTNNTALLTGGAITSYASTMPSYLNINNCLFIGNYAGNSTSNGEGGGVYIRDSVTNITNSNFTDNGAYDRGGAIGSWSEYSTASVFVSGCNFVNNYAYGALNPSTASGAILLYADHPVNITNNRFYNNWDPLNQIVYSDSALSNATLDYNWWGMNYLPEFATNALAVTTNYYVVNVTFDNVTGETVYFNYIISLNGTNTSVVTGLPIFLGDITTSPDAYNGTFDANVSQTLAVPVTGEFGNITFNFTIDYWSESITVFVQDFVNSTINVPNNATTLTNIIITGVLTDEDGNPIPDVILNISINDTNFTTSTTGSDGSWNFTYNTTISGTYEVIVSWNGTELYANFTNSTTFDVDPIGINSTINVPPSDDTEVPVTISGVLTDANGNPVENATLTVDINGTETFTPTTDSNGNWDVTFTPADAGNYIVTVSWAGNETYAAFSNSANLAVSVNPTNSTIVVPPSVNTLESIEINGTLTYEDDGPTPIEGVVLNITINGVIYQSEATDSNGFWNLTYTPTVAGNFTVLVSWAGNDTFAGFTNSTILNVSLLGTNSSINVISPTTTLVSTDITGILLDYDENPVVGAVLTITINSENFTATTGSDGSWTLPYTPSISGTFEVLVSWAGNGTYEGFTNSSTLIVNPIGTNSTIIVPSNVTTLETVNINGTLLDNNNDTVVGAVLNISINNVNFTATTDINGFWNISYNSSVNGTFAVNVSWDGNETYAGFTNTTPIVVNLLGINSTIVIPSNITTLENISITGILSDDNGNRISGVDLNVTIGDEEYNATTSINGAWEVSFNSTVNGTFNISVSWDGNTTYANFTNSTDFTVYSIGTNSTINVPAIADTEESIPVSGVLTDANGNPVEGALITVEVDGNTNSTTTDSGGNWNVTFDITASGNYIVTVNWTGNTTYAGFTNTTTLSVAVTPTNSTIIVPLNVTVLETIEINGTLTATDGVDTYPVEGVVLNITINGVIYQSEATDSNGFWNLSYTPTTGGSFSVVVSWAGNETFATFTNNTTLVVNFLGTNSTIIIPSNVTTLENITINGTLSDDDENPIGGVDLTIIINGVNYNTTTDSSGNWNFNFTANITGNYSFSVSWAGNETYAGFNNSTTFFVNLIGTNTTIVVPNNATYDEAQNINGTVTNDNGNPVVGATVTVTVNGTAQQTTTDSSGFWNVTFNPPSGGTYTVNVTFAGNTTYAGFNSSTVLHVDLAVINSTINVPTNVNINETINITGNVSEVVNGTEVPGIVLNITINGVYYNTTTEPDGTWSLEYTPIIGGNLSVVVSYEGDASYGSFINSTTLVVNFVPTSSTIVLPTNATALVPTEISGNFTDSNGDPVVGVNLTVTINGVDYTVPTLANGSWSLNYTPSIAGNLNVTVTFSGNDIYDSFTDSSTLVVSLMGTNSTILVPQYSETEENATITGVLTDDLGNPVVGVNITVSINGTNNQTVTTNTTGGWNLTFLPLIAGIYNITVTWDGDATYAGFTNSTNMSVSLAKTNSTIVVPTGVTVNDSITISGVLWDLDNDEAIEGAVLTITINNASSTLNPTLSNGSWSFAYTPTIGGNLSVVVSWAGNETYYGFTNSTTLEVNFIVINSTIIVPSGVTVNENTTISGVLTNGSTPVEGVILTITINNVSYNSTPTLANGSWSLNYTPSAGGNLPVSVSFAGNNVYAGFTSTTTWSVAKLSINATPPSLSTTNVTVGQSFNISGTLTDASGNPIIGATVNININGTNYPVITDSNGNWVLPYTPTSGGNFSVSVSWPGNSAYSGFSYSFILNVARIYMNSSVVLPAIGVVQFGQTITITGYVIDGLGNPVTNLASNIFNNEIAQAKEVGNLVSNTALSVTIGGQTYFLTTDSNGKWTLNYKVNLIGNITVTVNSVGTNVHANFANSTSFIAVKGNSTSNITVTQNPNGSVTIRLKLTDASGDPIANQPVEFLLDGKVIGSGTTNSNGIATFTIPASMLNNGKHTFGVMINGSGNFNSGSSSVVFTVNTTNNSTNNSTNNPHAKATMRETGIPVLAIIVVFLISILIGARRK